MISAQLKNHYWEKGWVVVNDVFRPEKIEPIARLAMAVALQELQDVERSGQEADVDRDDRGNPIPRKVIYPFLKSEHFRMFVLDSRLIEILDALMGKTPLLVFDQIFMKPPRHGSAKPYHQDNAYFLCHPPDEVTTAWIALDDVDEENGCLRYINGSHRGPILRHHEVDGARFNLTPDESDFDLNDEAVAPVRKGGVVIHHANTLHTSHANRSDRWRRGYASHWVTADVRSENDTLDRAFFNAHADLYESTIATRIASSSS